MKKTKQKQNTTNKGFIILFAMLISTIILLVSAGVYSSVQKQVVLSSYARESQKAFYAADAGIDCALFNDISPLLVVSAFPIVATPGYNISLTCGGGATTARVLEGGIQTGDDNFTASYVYRYYGVQDLGGDHIASGCSYVLVEKKGIIGEPIETRITAAGFNTCKEGLTVGVFDVPDFDNPTLLERRLSISYTTI